MQSYPPSQDEVVTVFVQALNVSRGAAYAIASQPDQAERKRAEVDYILRDENHPLEIAVEVSSAWRSQKAGKEDADWGRWIDRVRERVRGRARGQFRVFTPLQPQLEATPEAFADALVELVHREAMSLASLHRTGKGANFTLCGMKVFVSHASAAGSDVSFARILSEEEDGNGWATHMEEVLARKSPKLKSHREMGRETWLVIYNTFWTAMSLLDVREIMLAALGPAHAHIDHVGVISGNPPDDAWLDVIR